ncbi:glycosyltransferase family 2 protein [Flavobacterium sp.]|uniref:glycosyltransferase family 2 protein n=1 Tax=Flavobacterium sp. TaxID=239 RepID=UPI003D0E15A3
MIILFHNNFKITRIQSENLDVVHLVGSKVVKGLIQLVEMVPGSHSIVWCHERYSGKLNLDGIKKIAISSNSLYSFNPNKKDFFDRVIGYVDLSISIAKKDKNKYPTWLVSSAVGVAKIKLIKLALESIPDNSHFDYFLKSFVKLIQNRGLFSYSEPSLLTGYTYENDTFSVKELCNVVRFTKQHFKFVWIFFLFYTFLIYEKKYIVFLSFFSLFYKRRYLNTVISIEGLNSSSSIDVSKERIDVLIPTIGRETYLLDVLCDLKGQTLLPKNVIIIEQNPDNDSVSNLNYLNDQEWPFEIVHVFTHQTGACNARNMGLNHFSSDWLFLADDDIRISEKFIESALQKMLAISCEAASFKCTNVSSVLISEFNPFQWGGFGAGSSIVKKSAIKGCRFGMGYEFGFGEDGDFGMQIRNHGIDVLFFEAPSLIHLKAPMGGFRNKPVLDWANEIFSPKPSPTVMLYRIKHCTKEQNITYKLKLFLSFYREQSIKNPIRYYTTFKKQWGTSQKWATILLKRNES